MLRCAVKIVSVLLVVVLVSCKVEIPKDVLPPEKMERVLYDYHLTQAMITTVASYEYKEKLMFRSVYDKHNISKELFDSSLVWYNRYPKYMKEIYNNLETRLQNDVDILGGAKVLQNEGIDLDAANLAPNIAELWTDNRVKMLSSSPLNNKISFSFDTPKDSSFVVGDSLVLSFNVMFISENEKEVKQEVYTAINLEYSDESHYSADLSVKESGHFTVSAPRNNSSRLKSMSGFIFYFDNDALNASRVVLNDLSVKRLHPSKSKNTKTRK